MVKPVSKPGSSSHSKPYWCLSAFIDIKLVLPTSLCVVRVNDPMHMKLFVNCQTWRSFVLIISDKSNFKPSPLTYPWVANPPSDIDLCSPRAVHPGYVSISFIWHWSVQSFYFSFSPMALHCSSVKVHVSLYIDGRAKISASYNI
jgi:hypothetical protein